VRNKSLYCGKNRLSNFVAKINKQITVHKLDGDTETLCEIKGYDSRGRRLSNVKVEASKFHELRWVRSKWGAHLEVPSNVKDKVRLADAILDVSGDIKQVEVFQNSGYRLVHGERVYVHENGAITRQGTDRSICLAAQSDSHRDACSWPDMSKVSDEAIEEAIACVMQSVEISSTNKAIGLMMILSAFRPLLTYLLPIDSSIFLVGKRETFKTSIAKLIRSFYNPEATAIPVAQWSSTANGLLGRIEQANNGVIVIDDFVFSQHVRRVFLDKAEEVLRNAANGRGRDRLKGGNMLQDVPHLNALVVATGEVIPLGSLESLHARVIYLPIKSGDIDTDQLRKLQGYASEGVFALSAAAFVQFLLRQDQDSLAKDVNDLQAKHRKEGGEQWGLSNRRAEQYASLMVTWELLMDFFYSKEAMNKEECHEWVKTVKTLLAELLNQQNALTEVKNINRIVCESIRKGLAKLNFYIVDLETHDTPKDLKRGFKKHDRALPDIKVLLKDRPADQLGWYDSKTKRLYIDAKFPVKRIIDCVPQEYREQFSTSKNSFWKDLQKENVLVLSEESHNTVRRKFGGANKPSSYYCILLRFKPRQRLGR